jgi:chromosome segregation ATPase
VFVTATGEAAADRFRFTVLVLAQGEYVERASRIAESLEATLDSASPGRGRKSGLRNQARTLRRRLESISADLEGQRPPNRSIDTQLNAARNMVDAMERRVILLEPSVERQELLYTLESIGDRIDDAIEALP